MLGPVEKEAAKNRQLSSLKHNPARIVRENFLNDCGRMRDKVAAYVGVSGRTLEKALGPQVATPVGRPTRALRLPPRT